MNPTKNELPAEKRASLAQLLNERLADLIDLGLQAKQAHWNVKGPTFIALHDLFDSVAEETNEFVDDVAERNVALGGIAEGTIGIVGKRTKLAAYPVDITSGRDHVEALSTALATVEKPCEPPSTGRPNSVMRTPPTSSRESQESLTRSSGSLKPTCKATSELAAGKLSGVGCSDSAFGGLAATAAFVIAKAIG